MNFFTETEESRIVQAIRRSEEFTTGEIRIYVEDFCLLDDPLERAIEVFYAFSMEKTANRNAVLIYLAHRSRLFAIVGDEGIHTKAGGQSFWRNEKYLLANGLKAGNHCQAVINVIEDIGRALEKYFPIPDGYVKSNELPDEILYGAP